jgi:hypothetical protein
MREGVECWVTVNVIHATPARFRKAEEAWGFLSMAQQGLMCEIHSQRTTIETTPK